jgi:hypothetical protein
MSVRLLDGQSLVPIGILITDSLRDFEEMVDATTSPKLKAISL